MKDLHDEEVRVTDESGGEKGKKLAQLGAMDPAALIELARVAGMGANKYEAFNYLKGYDWSLSFDAMQRHALLFWAGEDVDPESGLSHMAHAAWMALSLVSFAMRGLGNDDRFRQPEAEPTPEEEMAKILEDVGRGFVSMQTARELMGYFLCPRKGCILYAHPESEWHSDKEGVFRDPSPTIGHPDHWGDV